MDRLKEIALKARDMVLSHPAIWIFGWYAVLFCVSPAFRGLYHDGFAQSEEFYISKHSFIGFGSDYRFALYFMIVTGIYFFLALYREKYFKKAISVDKFISILFIGLLILFCMYYNGYLIPDRALAVWSVVIYIFMLIIFFMSIHLPLIEIFLLIEQVFLIPDFENNMSNIITSIKYIEIYSMVVFLFFLFLLRKKVWLKSLTDHIKSCLSMYVFFVLVFLQWTALTNDIIERCVDEKFRSYFSLNLWSSLSLQLI